MIRIKPRRCGYGGEKGYTCQRLPQLQDWMFNEEIPFIAQMQAEFNKLPLRVKGMVYTEETIDMGWSEFGPHPEVPELTCRSNTDPASDTTDVSVWGTTGIPVEVGNATAYPVYGGSSGWLDLFNSGYEITGGTQYFYHNVSGTAAATSDVYIKVTGVDHEYHDIYLVGNIPTFKNGEQEMEMGPGLLEPMLDTDFAPVGIDTIPAWEAGLDADIFTNIVLNAWKGVIDDRIQNIYARLNTLPAYDTDQKLRDLTVAENKDSECDNFQISLESGSPVRDPDDVDAGKYHAATLPNADNTSTPITVGSQWHSRTVTAVWQDAENIWWWTVEDDPNQYTISGGDIAYGDNTISVVGLSGLYAPFYAYLMPSFDVTITHTDVVAADVPTVVDGGTARMITDGDVLPSGGTVTGFTSSGSGAATRYAWETVGDNTAEIRTKTGSQLSEEGTADPEPGGIGIGGVRIIQSVAESDPLILYKIYHEDCIAGIEKPEAAADAATAGWLRLSPVFPYEEELMNVEIPSGTEGVDPTVIGATAGIVQPVHNIQIHGSTEYRTQSPVDVPTVEAVYNFIHNYDDFADGEFEQASALATGSTMYTDGSSVAIYTKEVSGYTGSLAVPGTAIIATDIKTILVEGRTVTASGCVPTAQAVVDYIGDLTFDGVGSTVGIIGYTTNVPETLWPIPGSTVDPAAGYVQNVRNIYVAGTHSVSGYAVPTVDAVYHFIHGTTVEGMTFSSALATAGTMSYHGVEGTTVTGAEQGVYEVVENIVTLDENGSVSVIGSTTAQGYVPEAQAVVDWTSAFVSGYTATAGVLSKDNVQSEFLEGARSGIATVARNIEAQVTGDRSYSTWVVPTVEAVINFIHGDTIYNGGSEYPTASALAEIGRIEGSTWEGSAHIVTGVTASGCLPGTCEVVSNILAATVNGTYSSVDNVVPTADAVVKYVDGFVKPIAVNGWIQIAQSGAEELWETTIPAAPGIVQPVSNIKLGTSPHFEESSKDVPTVKAVHDFVHWMTDGGTFSKALATGVVINAPAGQSTVANLAAGAIPGTCFVVTNMMGMAGDGVILNTDYIVGASTISLESVVPTVAAVKAYVDAASGGVLAVVGELVTSSSDPFEDIDDIGATTAAPGTVWTVENILLNGTDDATHRPYSKKAVPTVEAVVNYIRGTTISNTDTESSLAVAGSITQTPATGEPTDVTFSGGQQGVVNVTSNIIAVNGETSCTDCVPTADAVVKYVSLHGGTGGDGVLPNYQGLQATGGPGPNGIGITFLLPVKPNESTWFTVGSGMSYDAVFATEDDTAGTAVSAGDAVSSSVAGYIRLSIIDPGQNQTAGCVRLYTPTASSGVPLYKSNGFALPASGNSVITISSDAETVSGEPGRVYISNGVNFGGDRAYSKITAPSVEAVYDFIHGTTASGVEMLSALADIAGSTITGTTALALVEDTKPGTVYVTNDFTLYGSTVTTYNDPQAVPTVKAVVDYVRLYGGSTDLAVVGSFTATTSAEAWVSGSTASAGIFKVVKDVKMATTDSDAARSISRTSVPTVEAVYLFVSGYTATVGSFTATSSAETWVSGSTAIAGITKVVSNIAMASTDTEAARSISKTAVPTVEAVKKYVDDHVYTGPFAVEATGTGTNVKIKEGKAYFGTTVFTYAGIASTAMANSATLYAKCTKGSSTITIVTTDTTGSTVACFPIASKDASGNITQRQWGDINIMGRWM